MNRSWRIVFRGEVSDETLARLPRDVMTYVSGHPRPRRRSVTLWVQAKDAATAEQAVRDAIRAEIESVERLPYWGAIGVPEDDARARNVLPAFGGTRCSAES